MGVLDDHFRRLSPDEDVELGRIEGLPVAAAALHEASAR